MLFMNVYVIIISCGSRMSQTVGTNPQGGGANLLFGQIFLENCMKMKEVASGGRASLAPPLDPPRDVYHQGFSLTIQTGINL